jgi:hypothetical protein
MALIFETHFSMCRLLPIATSTGGVTEEKSYAQKVRRDVTGEEGRWASGGGLRTANSASTKEDRREERGERETEGL